MHFDISKNINFDRFAKAGESFKGASPFDHCVIDGFFSNEMAQALEKEFPSIDAPLWREYHSPLEDKKACNDWERFKPLTYQVFSYLISRDFIDKVQSYLGISPLYPDPGLSGGGWHAHGRGGKNNVHLDYSIHPKLELERRVNLLVYMNSKWTEDWGGVLSLWDQKEGEKSPGNLIKEVVPQFNRAVLFDTTQNSWHGLPKPIECPEGETRRSLAVYYLTDPSQDAEQRGKALFAPYGDQADDPEILELIRTRSSIETAASVYNKDD